MTKTQMLLIPLDIIVTNPRRKSTHKCPCKLPGDSAGMDYETFSKSYGPHVVQAVYDLLQHPSFKQGLEFPKLIVAPE